jgi:hypothetical protein
MALARDRITTELVINCAITERNLARVAAAALFNSTRFFRKERGLGLGFPVFHILFSLYNANYRIGMSDGDLSGCWRINGPRADFSLVKTDSACSNGSLGGFPFLIFFSIVGCTRNNGLLFCAWGVSQAARGRLISIMRFS